MRMRRARGVVGTMLLTGMSLAAIPAAAAPIAPIGILRSSGPDACAASRSSSPRRSTFSRALRAGHSFSTAIEMVAEEMPTPMGPEFASSQRPAELRLGDA